MKDPGSVLERKHLAWVLITALLFLVSDPLGVLAGNFSEDSYSQMRSEAQKTKNPKVLLVGSWDDFYSLEYNNYWLREVGGDFVERNYGEVLDAASLGNDFFNRYLQFKGISHVLVPRTTFDQGVIRHKFTNRGSIEIELRDPFFKMVSSSNGPYASVLLEVLKTSAPIAEIDEATYKLSWKNTDWWFFTKQAKITEVGLYNYSLSPFHEWGPELSWYFDLSPERSNVLEIDFESSSKMLKEVNLELTLVSAYGPNAPPHEVLVSAANYSEKKTLSPNNPGIFKLKLKTGGSVKIKNVTPCRLPRTFEPTDLMEFEICFGVSKVFISPKTQGE